MDGQPSGKPSAGNGGKPFADLFSGGGGRKTPADLFNGTGGKEKSPAPSATPPAPSIRADTSAFELLTRKIGEEEARRLRRFLIECSQGDENSYVFNHTLVTLAQWHMAAAVPVETAKVLDRHANTAQDAARAITQAADAKLAEFKEIRADVGEAATELKARVEQLEALAQGADARFRRLFSDLETVIVTTRQQQEQDFAARQQRTWAWALGAGIVVAAVGWLATYQLERQAGERWKAEQTAQLTQWRAQQAADWPKWAEGQARARLQALEPDTYRLAQQIERSKRQVKLPEGGTGWEVTLFDDAGILSVDSTFDAQNIRQRYQVHLRDDPERLALSVTAPAGSGDKERARP